MVAPGEIAGVPSVVIDDGVCLIFTMVDAGGKVPTVTTGFLHTPISASEPFGSPPVTWSRTSDLGSWVETVKYAARNNRTIQLFYDLEATNPYTIFSGVTFQLSVLYGMSA